MLINFATQMGPALVAVLIYLLSMKVSRSTFWRVIGFSVVACVVAFALIVLSALDSTMLIDEPRSLRQLAVPSVAVVAITLLITSRGEITAAHSALEVMLLNAIAAFTALGNPLLALFLDPLLLLFPQHLEGWAWPFLLIAFWPSWLILGALFLRAADMRVRWMIVVWVELAYLLLLASSIEATSDILSHSLVPRFIGLVALSFVALHALVVIGNTVIPLVLSVHGKVRPLTYISGQFDTRGLSGLSGLVALSVFAIGAYVVIIVLHENTAAYVALLALPVLIELFTGKRTDGRGPVTRQAAERANALLISPRIAAFALISFALYVTIELTGTSWEFVIAPGYPMSNAIEAIRYATGAVAMLAVTWVACGLLNGLGVTLDGSSHKLKFAVMSVGLILFSAWHWQQIALQHPHVDGERLLRDGTRIYLWEEDRRIGRRSPGPTLYREVSEDGISLSRSVLCHSYHDAKLISLRHLDDDLIECEWDRDLQFSRSRFRVVSSRASNDRSPVIAGGNVADERTLEPVTAGAKGQALSCQLIADTGPSLSCDGFVQELPVNPGTNQRTAIHRWHVDRSQRFEFVSAKQRFVCLTAEVDANLPFDPVTRLSALVLVRWNPGRAVYDVRYLYDQDATCDRLQAIYAGEIIQYKFSDLGARRYLIDHRNVFSSLPEPQQAPSTTVEATTLKVEYDGR